ncbi:YhfH family protein [Sporosarcina sp. Sa2YVA2]|uniref:YhfH family protein n=1 Tax=Sporosarcina quadrami TaxID=2762234 RepID=A0ABR8UAZ5_9BACL|nr:protein YhfH [Sporosarcina quadrami]MBD7985208.1 YhfH family protein [Sporosarcina quadrami]
MVESIVEFFKNLPPKACTTCGTDIDEQHECYSNKCDTCNIL